MQLNRREKLGLTILTLLAVLTGVFYTLHLPLSYYFLDEDVSSAPARVEEGGTSYGPPIAEPPSRMEGVAGNLDSLKPSSLPTVEQLLSAHKYVTGEFVPDIGWHAGTKEQSVCDDMPEQKFPSPAAVYVTCQHWSNISNKSATVSFRGVNAGGEVMTYSTSIKPN